MGATMRAIVRMSPHPLQWAEQRRMNQVQARRQCCQENVGMLFTFIFFIIYNLQNVFISFYCFSNSNSDSNTESESDSPVKSEPSTSIDEPPLKRRLPSAAAVFSTKLKTGVMCNDYERAKLEHEAMLSRHVPLTDPKKTKPVCKAFQRGMCRRGKNCR